MTEQEQYVAIAQAILSLVSEPEQKQFQQWILDTQEDAYADAAERIMALVSKWNRTSWLQMDIGL